MNSLPDQFSAARQTQIDHGLNLVRSLSDQALDRTSRVFALQLDASRAALEQSSKAMRQLLAARDPRDLLALGSQSQQHLRTMFDYGRELFSIATAGLAVPALRIDSTGTAGPNAQAPAAPHAAADTGSAANFALPADLATQAEASVVTSNVEPQSAPTAIAQAASEALDMPVAPPHPVAASVPVEVAVEIDLPKMEPVDAAPPAAAVTTGPTETRGTKGRRKQQH